MRNLGALVLGGAISIASLPSWQRQNVSDQRYFLRPMQIMSFDSSGLKFSRQKPATESKSELAWLDYLHKKKEAAKPDYKPSTKQ